MSTNSWNICIAFPIGLILLQNLLLLMPSKSVLLEITHGTLVVCGVVRLDCLRFERHQFTDAFEILHDGLESALSNFIRNHWPNAVTIPEFLEI